MDEIITMLKAKDFSGQQWPTKSGLLNQV